MKNVVFLAGSLSFLFTTGAFAVEEINLRHQSAAFIASLSQKEPNLKTMELSRNLGPNNILHIRIQETYLGYSIWKADAVVHIPNSTHTKAPLVSLITQDTYLNGVFYQKLSDELNQPSTFILSDEQQTQALNKMLKEYTQSLSGAQPAIKDQKVQLIIYVDNSNKAHWSYLVNFYAAPARGDLPPAKPQYIIDATSLKVYEQWDEVNTAVPYVTTGGGIGNNKRRKFVYDGLPQSYHYSPYLIQREAATNTCYLRTADVSVVDWRHQYQVMTYPCTKRYPDRNYVYWREQNDGVNGGYSPSNDAIFGASNAIAMYKQWYNMDLMTRGGRHQVLVSVVHLTNYEGAYYDGSFMNFGDGRDNYYPFTSLGTIGHESSHAFTADHSKLIYANQSGGINEAYSDMAGEVLEYYKFGYPSWEIGREISKQGIPYRYMDLPSRNCNGGVPGAGCSINNANQYYPGLDVHFSSGVFDRAFYFLSISPTWNPRKAFQVMMDANVNYWTSASTFKEAACGVVQATRDRGYPTLSVTSAFNGVSINTSDC